MINIHFIDLVIIISIAQSFFLAVLIMQRHRDSIANKTLALLFCAYSLVLTQMLLWDIKFFMVYPRIMVLLLGAPFLIGPLHYLYTLYLSSFATVFKRKHLVHFIPFVLYELILLPQVFKSREDLLNSMTTSESGGLAAASLILNWLIMFHAMFYTVLIIFLIRKYSAAIRNVFSTIENIRLDWLRNAAIIFSACIIMYIIENSLTTSGLLTNNNYIFSSIAAAGFIYLLGFLAILKSEIFLTSEFKSGIANIETLQSKPKEIEESNAVKKYQKSGLTDEKAKEFLDTLIHIMESEKPYLDSSLTLNKLAQISAIPPHNLSEIINTRLNQSFFDFINKYRIEKVKADLMNPNLSHLTLLALAMEAGFNSKSSFNLIFKKYTGLTPSEYRKQQTDNNSVR